MRRLLGLGEDEAPAADPAPSGGVDADAPDAATLTDEGGRDAPPATSGSCRARPFGPVERVDIPMRPSIRAYRPWIEGSVAFGIVTPTPAKVFLASTDASGSPLGVNVDDVLPSDAQFQQANHPTISRDGLTLYVAGIRGTATASHVHVLQRPDLQSAFVAVSEADLAGPGKVTVEPWLVDRADGTRVLYFGGYDAGNEPGEDLYSSVISGGQLSRGFLLVGVNDTTHADGFPVVTRDELSLLFATTRTNGKVDIWQSDRASLNDPWGTPQPAQGPDLNLDLSEERPTWISDDGCTLYLTSNRAGPTTYELYRATR